MCRLSQSFNASENYNYSHSCTNNPRCICHIRRLYHDVLKKIYEFKGLELILFLYLTKIYNAYIKKIQKYYQNK